MLRIALATVLTSLALCSAGAAPASAAGWSTPQPLPADWGTVSLGFDGAGNATAAYAKIQSLTPIVTRLGFASRQPDGSWADQFTLTSAPGLVPVGATVAVGTGGAAAACVTALTTTDLATAQEFRLVTYRAAGASSWEPLTPVTTPGPRAGRVVECQPKVTPSGFAAVLVGKDAALDSLQLATRAPGGGWAQQEVSSPLFSAEWASLALDAAGNATVAWQHRWTTAPDRYSVRVRTRTASNGVMGVATALTPESGVANVGTPRIAVNDAGTGVLAFQVGTQLHVTYRSGATGAWEPLHPVFVDATASSSSPRAVGVSPGGLAYVLYWRQGPTSSDNSVAGMVRHGTFGSWTSHAPVSPSNADLRDAALPFLGETAVPVYNGTIGGGGGDPGTGIFQSARWPSFSPTPEPGVDLAAPGPPAYFETALADNAGSIVALHYEFAGTERRWLITAYDASAPALASAAVPAAVTVGEPAQLRSTFTDFYSPIASVTWDFGDGTPKASGATVTHAWAAPGPYTVTATARDSQGNETTQAFAVTAAAAPGPGQQPREAEAPRIALSLPKCKKKQKKAACTAARKKVSAWKTVRGTASDNVAVTRITVVAQRKKTKKIKKKTITAQGTLKGKGWSAKLKGLGKGKWTITATAVDAAGNAKSAKRTVTLR